MKNLIKVLLLTVCSFCFFGCFPHWQSEVVVIKNDLSSTILIGKQPDEYMTDSIVFNKEFSTNLIAAFTDQVIALPDMTFKNALDSEMVYLYVFNLDTLNKLIQEKKVKGILDKSLLKKVKIQLNLIKEPLDTIVINNMYTK
ncbi:hypothetical protein [Pedobacter cryoconitis]|uniref:hypothetical protein n=1 Tax=Pedobacter cryoconitis TaxID=188932 RepID=UPI00162016B6|nr:hypothetical protein [Pedobacter cryoconitis]MBB5648148.1 hypothetical protein [Pedobacter cryoconitis]